MTEQKHTPGPWAYDEGSGDIFYNDGDVFPVIASVNIENVSEEQADADGCLIAAAPDMLAELTKAESFISGFEGDELQEGIDVMLAGIRAAIASAEGRR